MKNYYHLGAQLLILFLVNSLINVGVAGQEVNKDIIPSPPEAASLGLFGQFQVGNFTGTSNISIPIFELKGSQLSCNVSLAYNSSGIRVEETSSWVGANWSLLAGGLISQNVRGIRDDNPVKGLFHRPLPQVLYSEDIDNCSLSEYCRNYYDSEPDIYTYSFGGYSGKFFFDESLNPITVPREPLIVNPIIDSNTSRITSWVVIDDKGFKYLFEILSVKQLNGDSDTASRSWYLEKIISADDQDTLSFTYDNYSTIYSQVFVSQNISEGGIGSYYLPDLSQNSTVVYEDNVYIKSIASSSGSIIFNKSDRVDDKIDNLKKLDSIEVYNKFGTLTKKLKFMYNNTGERLFLENIENITDGNTIRYEFDYYEDYLPDRFKTEAQAYPSYPIDYWGYYNGKSSNKHLIPKVFDNIRNFTPADRLPSLAYTQKGSLRKIVYPTGGYTRFYYELNKTKRRPLFYGSDIPNSEEYEIGGLRVSKIQNFDPVSGKSNIVRYEYPDQGYLSSFPVYGYVFLSNRTDDGCPGGNYEVKTISSNSQAYLNSINGSHIYYPIVKEIYGENGENGYSIYEYSTDNSGITEYMFEPPFTPNDGSSSYRAGLLLRKADFDVAGNPLKEIKNVYTISDYLSETIRGLRVVKSVETYDHYIPEGGCYQGKSSCENDEFYSAFYDLVSEWQYKSSDTTRLFDPDDQSKYVETINTYNYYNPDHQQLSSHEIHDSRQQSIVINYTYPSDAGSGAPPQMYMYDENNTHFKHMLSPIIERRVEVNEQTTAKVQNKYVYDSGKDMVLPDYSDIFPAGSSSYRIQYLHNDGGNLVEQYKDDDVKTVYLWDNTGTYLMAKIENASYGQVSSYDKQQDCSYSSENLHSALTGNISGAMVTTYTYKPLVGMTSQTDANGKTTYYEYDDFGRLAFVRDQNGNIVKKHEYHYAGQN